MTPEEIILPDRRAPDERRDGTPEWFREWRSARAEDAERIDRLESATERMAESARGLNATLSTFATKSQVEDVVRDTRSETFAQHEEVRKELVRYRKRVLSRVYGAAVIGGFLLVATVVGAVNYTSGKANADERYREGIYNVCVARSAQSENIRRLIDQPPVIPLSPTEQARSDANKVLLRAAFPSVSCGRLKP